MSRLPKKLVLSIDGANLHATGKAFGFDIDCKRLLNEFESWGTLLRPSLYDDYRGSGFLIASPPRRFLTRGIDESHSATGVQI
jgi:hypothetical protein